MLTVIKIYQNQENQNQNLNNISLVLVEINLDSYLELQLIEKINFYMVTNSDVSVSIRT